MDKNFNKVQKMYHELMKTANTRRGAGTRTAAARIRKMYKKVGGTFSVQADTSTFLCVTGKVPIPNREPYTLYNYVSKASNSVARDLSRVAEDLTAAFATKLGVEFVNTPELLMRLRKE